MTNEQFQAAVVATMKSEINADEDLRSCKSFSELHDHCDANLLGGAELLANLLGMERAVDVMNAAMDEVSSWLAAGRPEEAVA